LVYNLETLTNYLKDLLMSNILNGRKKALSVFFSKQADVSDHAAMWSPLVSDLVKRFSGQKLPEGTLPGMTAGLERPEGESGLLHAGLSAGGAQLGHDRGRFGGSWLGAILAGSLGLGANHGLAMLGSALKSPGLTRASKTVGDSMHKMIGGGALVGEQLGRSFGGMAGKRLGQRGASGVSKYFKGKKDESNQEHTIQPAEPWGQDNKRQPSANASSSVSVKGMGREEKPMKKEEKKDADK
jgi:hypothetical protein